MKRRILSLLLAVCMTLGMVPVTAFAAEAESETVTHPAAFAQAVTVDGAAAEAEWSWSGVMSGGTRFSFIWTKDTLYLALKSIAGETLAVTVNGQSVDVSGTVTATVKELAIPMSSVGVTVDSYSVQVDAAITFGEETWSGKIAFDPNLRNAVPDLTAVPGIGEGTAENLGYDFTDGVYHMWNRYNAEAAASDSNKKSGRVHAIGVDIPSVKETGKTKVVEFDFYAEDLPVITPAFLVFSDGYATIGVDLTYVNNDLKGFDVGISNTVDGLVFCVNGTADDPTYRTAPLGKQVGDTFHLRLEYTADNALCVYADDVFVAEFADIKINPAKYSNLKGSFWLNLFNGTKRYQNGAQLVEGGANDMDFTVSNVRIGTVETPDPLESLTFDTIKGSNASSDAIESDLVLPGTISTDMLTNAKLRWTSSDPAVVSDTGAIYPADEDAEVTLTVALVSDPSITKSFVVNVLAATALHPAAFASATVDGALEELGWALSGRLSGGTPFGFIWDTENLYLAIKAVEGAQLSGTVNGKALNASAAAVAGYLELAIPLKDADVVLDRYGVTVKASITYGEETWSGKIKFDPNLRNAEPDLTLQGFEQGTSDNLGYEIADGVYHMWNRYNAEATQSNSNRKSGRVYAIGTDITAVKETGKTKVVEFDFYAKSLPVITPAYVAQANGYAAIGLDMAYVNDDLTGFNVGISNTVDGLVFCVNGSDAATYRTASLGKQIGDTVHLRLEYTVEGDLTVYADDNLVAVFEDTYINASKYSNLKGSFWLNLFNGTNYYQNGAQLVEDGSNDMDFTVSNVRIGTVETPDPLESLTFDTIKGDNKAEDAITGNLNLITEFDTDILTGIKLQWTSSNPAVISANGVVKPTADQTEVVLTAALVSDPAKTKSFTVVVDSATTHPAAFAESVIVDGTADETEWAFSGKLSGGTRFGFIWDKNTLYFAHKATAAAGLVISVNGYDVDVSGAVSDTATEVAIPLSAIGVTVNSYEVVVNASVSLGDEQWIGRLAFDPQLRSEKPNLQASCGIVYGTPDNLGYAHSEDSYHLWNKYNSKATQSGSNTSGGRVYAMNTAIASLKDTGKTKVVEFDFYAAALPVISDPNAYNNTHATFGMNLSLVNGDRNGYNVGISNSADGLLFCINAFEAANYRAIPLGKQVGDTFHVRLEYDAGGDLTVYVDDILLGVFADTDMNADKWTTGTIYMLSMDLFTGNPAYNAVELLEDGSNDTDFTVSNLRLGTVEDTEPMEFVTFDTIKGVNVGADSITNDLQLPAEVPHYMLSGMGLTWTSSNPAVIAANGKIYPGAAATDVTLTAALTDNPGVTKSFTVTVMPFCIEALIHESDVTVDGKLDEGSWLNWKELTDGSLVSALWNKGMVYFAFETEADSAILMLNGHTVTVDLVSGVASGMDGVTVKQEGNIVELAVPHEAFGVHLYDYNQSTTLELTFSTAGAEASVPAGTELIFAGRSKDQTYPSVIESLTKTELLGRVDLMHLKTDLDLPAVFTNRFFEDCQLTWTSSNADVISFSGKITRHATDYGHAAITLSYYGTELWSADVTVDPLTLKQQPSASLVQIGFASDGIVPDGSLVGEDWVMTTGIMNGDWIVGEMGALWDEENLYLAFFGKEDWVLTVNGKEYTAQDGVSNGYLHEIVIPMADINAVADYGTKIDVSVAMDGGSWEGKLELTSTDWWLVGNRMENMPVRDGYFKSEEYRGGGAPTKNQGAVEIENGWHIYDLYDPDGNNPVNVRTYILFMGSEEYDGFDDRTENIMVEFDFEAYAMPVYDIGHDSRSSGYANYGITWSLSDRAGADKYSNVVMGGISNTPDGLYIVTHGSTIEWLKLNREVGDRFRIGLNWHADGTLDVYLDGELLASYPQLSMNMHAIGNCSFVINSLRSADAAAKPEDSIDVYMTNLAFGKNYSEGGLNTLSFDTIRGENESEGNILSDLVLPNALDNGQLAEPMDLKWSSTNSAVIDPATGKVTAPAAGAAFVTLTATDRMGNTKNFDLIVMGGENDNSGKLVVVKDINPAVGAAAPTDSVVFTLDTNNNSVVLDNGEVTAFTSVILRDGDAFSRVNRESLTLWVSDDNVTYTQIKDYKLLHVGENWYLYDFSAEARYVKVHYTHFDAEGSDFVGALSTMIAVGTGDFGANGGSWNETLVTVTNDTGSKWQDKAVTISGVAGDSSTRILLDGKYLYHYMDGTNIVVRIPDLAAGASVELTVLTGNTSAMDIANKEAVYEITYGTRETRNTDVGYYITGLKAGAPLPNGGTLAQDILLDVSDYTIYASFDGGTSWVEYGRFDKNVSDVAFGNNSWGDGGFIYDDVTGRIFYQMINCNAYVAADMAQSDSKIVVAYSDDGGKTWEIADVLEPDVVDGKPMNYGVSYNDGIMLTSYDGDGPNVDFVFTAGFQFDNNGAFCTRVAYSNDGGFTWQYSKSLITSAVRKDVEDGLSESSILENEDGVLVLYSRHQVKDALTFAKAYSYDKGITWTSAADTDKTDNVVIAEDSTVYSANTEAVMQYWDFDGDGVDETPLMIWSGNNAEGGTSYMRSPLNVAVSYDGLENFRNIQNLFDETYLEVFTVMGKWLATNPCAAQYGDEMIITFARGQYSDKVQMRVSDFDDWFYRTKGIYDSFEHGSLIGEGWSTVKGTAALSNAYSTNGNYAMHLNNALVTRSVPYFQNGTISMDLYFTGEAFTLELQPAYCSTMNKVAVISLEVTADGSVLCNGKATGLTLQQGWNAVEFELLLTEAAAQLSVNGNTADLAVNTRDDYICYITFSTTGTLYVDDVLAESDLDAEVYTGETQKPVELPKISGNLSLNETIDINFIIPAEVDMTDAVLVVKNAATGEDVEYTILPGIGGTTVVRFSAKANHMTDEITVQVFDAEGNALTQKASMSVRKYAGIRFAVAEETEKMMLIRMLDYGALAQINSGVTTDLANGIVTDDLRAFADAYDWADAVALEVPAGSGGVFKAGLALNETIDVTVYTAATNVADGDKFVVKCNGEELTEDQYIVRLLDDGRYVIRYSVKSNEMSDEIYIAIVGEDNTVKAETTLGVRIYAQKFLAAVPTGNQAAMLLAMLDYGALAQIYAGSTENLANCFVTDTLRQVLISYPWPAN